MVDVTTSGLIAAQLSANDTVLETSALTQAQKRLRRIRELGDAIERGVYSVSACELADAILPAGRRAN
jgi:anti-sigma28 factor (negative regulator of flagellin synthesis)